MSQRCHDAGDRPGCLLEADERYTMRFDDIGKPPLYWCAFCGPDAHGVNELLMEALKEPEFRKKFEVAVETAHARVDIERKKMS